MLAILPIHSSSPAPRLRIGGTTVLDATLRALRAISSIGPSVLARHGSDEAVCRSAIERPDELQVSMTATHPSRWQAIWEALEMEPAPDTVLLHEPERPLLPPDSLTALRAALRGDGTMLGVAVHETVKRVAEGRIVGTVPRETLYAVQAPSMFRRGPLESAVKRAMTERWACRDELQLARQAGLTLHLVEGQRSNLVIHTARDSRYAELRSTASESLDIALAASLA